LDEKSVAKSESLTKGSMNHLTHNLNQTPEQHFKEIENTIASAARRDLYHVSLERTGAMVCEFKGRTFFQFLDFLFTQPIKELLLRISGNL